AGQPLLAALGGDRREDRREEMIRYASAALAAVGLSALWLTPGAAQGQKDAWGTIKGRIVWGGDKLPKPEKVKVTVDQAHCLGKGDLFDNLYQVNPKNKGLKNVFVALKQPPGKAEEPLPVHPDLNAVPKTPVPLDQPRCLFMPRAVAVREGQKLLVKNSAPVNHNIRWTGDPEVNPGGNVTLPPSKE